ncbi:sensor histidine kinase [Agromyces albus]|uniref:sensor histidine kinase n=1 Tax=Agromyces albus TaxID=205332 RepID=UPI002783A86A|nr:ATP-binding protein [Agromyces albus]MDQ0574547.1 signal transduction histidine kinase [Agromyces albus]
MTLGLPGHLARDSMSRALVTAGHFAAFTCLAAAATVAIVSAIVFGDIDDWAAFILTVAMAVFLVAVSIFPTVTLTVVYLVVGAAVVCALTVIVMGPDGGFANTNNALSALPLIALLLVGGAGSGSVTALVWAALGYGLGEAATFLGVALVGGTYAPNLAAAGAFGLVVIVRTFDGLSRRSDSRQNAGLHRASQQSHELEIRHDYELRATARLHDTALSHLVAIAAAGSGPVDERLRVGIRQDLGLIVGRDWVTDHAETNGSGDIGARAGARPPASVDVERLPYAVAAAANAGLEVRVTGDLAVLGALGPRRAAALDAAVAQCLINVARHAGVDEAEVAVGLGGGEVTVAVMDSGVGFDEQEVPQDRIGLRTSIRARIEQEQGAVRLWSTKGIGTTIVLTVPEGGE